MTIDTIGYFRLIIIILCVKTSKARAQQTKWRRCRAPPSDLFRFYGFERVVTGSGSEHHREIKAQPDSHRCQWAVEVRSHYNGN